MLVVDWSYRCSLDKITRLEMYLLRKIVQILAAATLLLLLSLLRRINTENMHHAQILSGIHEQAFLNTSAWFLDSYNHFNTTGLQPKSVHSTEFRHGTPKSSNSRYTHVVVVPRLKQDNISWIADELPEINTAIYVVDDSTAPLHPPRNKGHEVMIYMTYVIDHYYDLPDIIVFMHAHRWTHHNIDLLGHDAAEMLRRLSSAYVIRQGYVNMRCRWSPGCPEWLHPSDTHEILAKQEEVVLSQCWHELFPSHPLPRALGQACCAQFAVSKGRVLSIPLSEFIFYRDWMSRTPLSDYVSGRIWEYLWQFVFTGQNIYCPLEHDCYCQAFGLCFESGAEYEEFEQLRRAKQDHELELRSLRESQSITEAHNIANNSGTDGSNWARFSYLSKRVELLGMEIKSKKQTAIEHGGNIANKKAQSGGYGLQDDESLG